MRETTLKKNQENRLFATNLKEYSHISIVLLLKTKIAGNSNKWFLISLSINGLNPPIKKHKLKDSIHKQDPAICGIQKTHLSKKERYYLRVNRISWNQECKNAHPHFPSKWYQETSWSSHSNIE